MSNQPLKLGDVVTYTLTPEECENINKPDGHKVQAVIKSIENTDAATPTMALIQAELRPGQLWQKSARYGSEEGQFTTEQEPSPETPTTTHTPVADANAPVVHTEGLPSGVTEGLPSGVNEDLANNFEPGKKY